MALFDILKDGHKNPPKSKTNSVGSKILNLTEIESNRSPSSEGFRSSSLIFFSF